MDKFKKLEKTTATPAPIRGQRASMMIFDCSFGCEHSGTCKCGKECPYDKKN